MLGLVVVAIHSDARPPVVERFGFETEPEQALADLPGVVEHRRFLGSSDPLVDAFGQGWIFGFFGSVEEAAPAVVVGGRGDFQEVGGGRGGVSVLGGGFEPSIGGVVVGWI